MSRAAGDPLGVARLWAAHSAPYLASALFAMTVEVDPEVRGSTVDEDWTLRLAPGLVAASSPERLGSLLVHHVQHLLRDHAARAREVPVDAVSATFWLRACDAEINDDLDALGLDLGPFLLTPSMLEQPDGLFAEEYHRRLVADLDSPGGVPRAGVDARGGAGSSPAGCGGGGGVDGSSPPPPDPSPGTGATRDTEGADDDGGAAGARALRTSTARGGLSPMQGDLVRRRVAHDVREQETRARGTVPMGLLRWATALLEPTVDWRAVLRGEVRRAAATATGLVDYTYSHPSRRAAAVHPAVMPSLRRPEPDVAIVCDTSASITDDLLVQALTEVDAITRRWGGGRGVRVISCDAAVHAVRRVMRGRPIAVVGGGGTDMRVGLAEAARLVPRPTVVIVLTDGLTPWPRQAPSIPVVVGLLGDGEPPPAWAKLVRIGAAG